MAEMIFPPILQVALVKNRQKMQKANLDSELSDLPGEIVRLVEKFCGWEKKRSPEIRIINKEASFPANASFF